jgi:alternative ribosome-rescue factor
MSNKCNVHPIEISRGVIKDNALKALVTSPVFKQQIEKPKKGKGSFARNAKHKGQERYPNAA